MKNTNTLLKELNDMIENKKNNIKDTKNNKNIVTKAFEILSSLKKENNVEAINEFEEAMNNKENGIQKEYSNKNYDGAINRLKGFINKYNKKKDNVLFIDKEIITEILSSEIYSGAEINSVNEKIKEYETNVEKNKDNIDPNKYNEYKENLKDLVSLKNKIFNLFDELIKIVGNNIEDNEYWTKEAIKIESEIKEKYGEEVSSKLLNKLNNITKRYSNGLNYENIIEVNEYYEISGINKNNNKEDIKEENKETKEDNIETDANTNTNTEEMNSDIPKLTGEVLEEKNDKKEEIKEENKEEKPLGIEGKVEEPEKDKKPIKKRCKVKKVIKDAKEWFEKHPVIKRIVLGLALCLTIHMGLSALMVVNSALWTALGGKGAMCGFLHMVNLGLSKVTTLGTFKYVAESGHYVNAAGSVLYEAVAPKIIEALTELVISVPLSKHIINKIKNVGKEQEQPKEPEKKEEPKDKKIEELEQRIKELEEKLKQKEQKIDDLEEKDKQKEQKINNLEEQLKQKDNEINNYKDKYKTALTTTKETLLLQEKNKQQNYNTDDFLTQNDIEARNKRKYKLLDDLLKAKEEYKNNPTEENKIKIEKLQVRINNLENSKNYVEDKIEKGKGK